MLDAQQQRVTFEFRSQFNANSTYRVYVDGRADTLIKACFNTLTLSYSDASPALTSDVDAFNAMLVEKYDAARAIYPETGPAPIYTPMEAV